MSLNDGPIFFVAMSWHVMQPLLFASASDAFAVPDRAMPATTTAAKTIDFIFAPSSENARRDARGRW
jgi:hypothetical protein